MPRKSNQVAIIRAEYLPSPLVCFSSSAATHVAVKAEVTSPARLLSTAKARTGIIEVQTRRTGDIYGVQERITRRMEREKEEKVSRVLCVSEIRGVERRRRSEAIGGCASA